MTAAYILRTVVYARVARALQTFISRPRAVFKIGIIHVQHIEAVGLVDIDSREDGIDRFVISVHTANPKLIGSIRNIVEYHLRGVGCYLHKRAVAFAPVEHLITICAARPTDGGVVERGSNVYVLGVAHSAGFCQLEVVNHYGGRRTCTRLVVYPYEEHARVLCIG